MVSKATYPSMIETLVPANIVINSLAVFAGSLLIVIGAQVYIPLPFTPVPITAQTLFVMFIGSVLGSRKASMSVLLYILYGLIGFPVFSQGASGGALLGATGGYIFGFLLAAYVVGKLSERGWDRTVIKGLMTMFFGQVLIFVPGLLWLSLFVGLENVLALGLYPFVIGGIVKALLASSSAVLAWKLLRKLKGENHG